MVFENQFKEKVQWTPELEHILAFLKELRLANCYYGSTEAPVLPFICELVQAERGQVSNEDIINSLKLSPHFSEELNDQIHNDFHKQHIFSHDLEEGEKKNPQDGTEGFGNHGALKNFVRQGKLWYVIAHQTPNKEYGFSEYVVLFAVGVSNCGRYLVGVVSYQSCHNLCD
eukprot:TRINITY_DN3716_c0_g1_i1.p1 TRINITY_DN3716_c0_g1~~TRINITY_DN3716_c0_g1_i1.p1  ORF type:complete len:171 (+),score=30.06 TRINITY_DN3716_c0_g1_i1:289-801(+)